MNMKWKHHYREGESEKRSRGVKVFGPGEREQTTVVKRALNPRSYASPRSFTK